MTSASCATSRLVTKVAVLSQKKRHHLEGQSPACSSLCSARWTSADQGGGDGPILSLSSPMVNSQPVVFRPKIRICCHSFQYRRFPIFCLLFLAVPHASQMRGLGKAGAPSFLHYIAFPSPIYASGEEACLVLQSFSLLSPHCGMVPAVGDWLCHPYARWAFLPCMGHLLVLLVATPL